MKRNRVCKRRRPGIRAASAALVAAGLLTTGAALAQGQIRTDQREGNTIKPKYQHGLIVKSILEQINYIKHNLYLSLGPVAIQSYTDSAPITLENVQGLAAQALGQSGKVVVQGGSDLGEKLIPGGTLGMYIPLTHHHLATEVLIAGPIKTTFEARGRAANTALAPAAINGANGEPVATNVPAVGTKIGTLKALPPNITFVYRPLVGDHLIKPYIGLGVAYLYTYDTDVNNDVFQKQIGNEPILSLSKPIACIGKVGADINLPKRWFMRLEALYMGCADVKARITGAMLNSATLSPAFGNVPIGPISTTTHVKVVAYQISFGIKF